MHDTDWDWIDIWTGGAFLQVDVRRCWPSALLPHDDILNGSYTSSWDLLQKHNHSSGLHDGLVGYFEMGRRYPKANTGNV